MTPVNSWAEARACLDRTEERGGPRDSRGNFELAHSERFWEALPFRPFIDEELARAQPMLRERILWPGRADYAVLLSHDVDQLALWSRIEHWRRLCSGAGGRGLGALVRSAAGLRHANSTEEHFLPWMDLEREFGVRSTWYVSAGVPERAHPRDNRYELGDRVQFYRNRVPFCDCLKTLVKEGWEVGLHGSIEAATTGGMLAAQKEKLENAIGSAVTATRFHNLSFDIGVTPGLVDAAGFATDSTLGSNRMAGFRSGTCYPHGIRSGAGGLSVFLEIPLAIQDSALLRADNLDLAPDAAFEVCRKLLERVRAVKGVLALNWHPYGIGDAAWFALYRRLLELIKDTRGWCATASEIANCWRRQKLDAMLAEVTGRAG